MSILTSDLLVTGQDLYSQVANVSTTVPYYTTTPLLGGRAVTGDGREFRLVQAGATALVVGKLQQASAQVANHQNLTPTAAALGATQITVTLGNTAATANQYLNGYALITVDSGGTPGYMYQISGNPAANASATLTLQLSDPVAIAITASAKIDLIANNYSAIIVNPATASSNPVGVAIYPVTAAYYGWIQTKGVTNILADGAITVGTALVASNGVAGAVEPAAGVQSGVGIAVSDISTTEYGAVEIDL